MADTRQAQETVRGVGQICITVKDLERSVAFYRDVVGLPFLFQAPPGMAFFRCGDLRLMLAEPEKPEQDHPASILYYRVDDIRQAFDAMQGRGARVEREPRLTHRDARHELWLAFFRDPDGNLFSLMSEVPVTEA